MPTIHIDRCPFTKSNLVTQFVGKRSFDTYCCQTCGATGKRFGFLDKIELATSPACFVKKPSSVTVIDDIDQFGLLAGVQYAVVPSPERKFKDDVWVFSQKRNEPVRLFDHEYQPVESDK